MCGGSMCCFELIELTGTPFGAERRGLALLLGAPRRRAAAEDRGGAVIGGCGRLVVRHAHDDDDDGRPAALKGKQE